MKNDKQQSPINKKDNVRPSASLFFWAITTCLLINACSFTPAQMPTIQNGDVEPAIEQISCGPEAAPAPVHKKSVVLLRYMNRSPDHLTGLDGLEDLLSMRLQQYLEQRNRYILIEAGHIQLASEKINTLGSSGLQIEDQIKQIALSNNAQFVIAADIIDLAEIKETSTVALPALRKTKEFVNKTFLSDKRGLSTRIHIYDGISGLLLNQFDYFQQASGNVNFKKQNVFDKSIEKTDFGKAIHASLSQQVNDIDSSLACIPLLARVINIEENKVYLDVGVSSRLMAGDSIKILRRKYVSTLRNGKELNQLIEVADIAVSDVYPLFSVAISEKTLMQQITKGDFALAH